jgi:tetratricopeptide (TPR) repeat protein
VFYGKHGNYLEAILELEQAFRPSGYADAYNALAVVYHRQKQYEHAIANYLLAIEQTPGM